MRSVAHVSFLLALAFSIGTIGTIGTIVAQDARPNTRREFFGLDKLWDIHVVVPGEVWKGMFPRRVQNAQNARYPYGKAKVRIAGHGELEVGLRFKGQSTFFLTTGTLKRSFKIDFDRYVEKQKFLGLKKLSLNNNSIDGTQIREAVSYQAYRGARIPASRTAFARVFLTIEGEIQDEYLGLYTLVEQVDRGFLQRNIGTKGAILKPTWQVLRHYGDTWNRDYERGYVAKTSVSPEQGNTVAQLAGLMKQFRRGFHPKGERPTQENETKGRAEFVRRLEPLLDIDEFLRYVAVTTLIGNQDSPFTFPHNYYLVVPDGKNGKSKVQWLPWDLNNSFAGLRLMGSNEQLQRMSIMEPTHLPIVVRVLDVPEYEERYKKIVRELITGCCSARQMTAAIHLARKTTGKAIDQEAERSEIVTKAGDIGGGNRRSILARGRSFFVENVDLTKFVAGREKSVLDQLAGRSDGVAARPSLLTMLGQRDRTRSRNRSRQERGGQKPLDDPTVLGGGVEVQKGSQGSRDRSGTGGSRAQDRTQNRRIQDRRSFLLKTRVVARFDKDKNGRLDAKERAAAREYIVNHPDARRRMRMGRSFSRGRQNLEAEPQSGKPIRPESVIAYPKQKLYDRSILRTLFLDFEKEDWYQELLDFYKTDVDVPATLTVDGKKYEGVGVRVRGTSSFLMTGASKKKAFNISIDHTDPKLRLRGFRTLNLLNGNQDPTFLRDAIFAHVAGEFIPTPRVNYVKLVINGENWGVYVNVQQFNRDFLRDWFRNRKGVRWKILRNSGGRGALCYLGDDKAHYRAYELKTTGNNDEGAWQRLIHFCKVLNETPAAELPNVLPDLLDVDEALWFCALENAFLPNDGYVNQGYDYRLFEDRYGRFHLIAHDNNEILPQRVRTSRFGTRTTLGLDASPLLNADNPQRPIIHRLLAVREWRARYLAHMRTIATTWLDWKVLGPVCSSYHDLIHADIEIDNKKLFRYETFLGCLEEDTGDGRRVQKSLRWIVEARQKRILSHPSMQGPWPQLSAPAIASAGTRDDGRGLRITVRVSGKAKIAGVFLHLRSRRAESYRATVMRDDGKHGDGAAGDGVYGVTTPSFALGTKVSFYVEARSATGSAFHPEKAEAGPLSHRFPKR